MRDYLLLAIMFVFMVLGALFIPDGNYMATAICWSVALSCGAWARAKEKGTETNNSFFLLLPSFIVAVNKEEKTFSIAAGWGFWTAGLVFNFVEL